MKTPKSKDAVLIEYHDNGPDSLGRRHFSFVWWDEGTGNWRGQHFFGKPEEHVQSWRSRGFKVEEADR